MGTEEFDWALLGFDEEELAQARHPGITDGLIDPDLIPEPPDDAITQPGDLWTLGDHRLLCGDSGSEPDLDRLLDGATIDLVNMDPPYNVNVQPRTANPLVTRAQAQKQHANKPGKELKFRGRATNITDPDRPKERPLEGDAVSDDDFAAILRAWFGNASRVLKPGGSFYIWGGYINLSKFPTVLEASGLYFSQGIVWDKQWPLISHKDFMLAFEIAFYGWKEGAGHKFYGENNITDLWHVKKLSPQAHLHLTEKPVELAVRAIQYSSLPGENVLDLFGGSGSTLIGCEQTGRKAFLMEIDALYCDVIVTRWQEFTGQKAKRAAAAAR